MSPTSTPPGAADAGRPQAGATPPPQAPPAPPPPQAPAAPPQASAATPPPTGTGFFGWLRTLGVPRLPGWIGGVAAGIAARLNIDPIIVRGVLVVFALFGAPAFLLYGAAWLLLPDTSGRIHLERLFAGVWDRALVGIAAFLLVGLFPLAFGAPSFAGGLWEAAGGGFWGMPWFNPFGFNPLPIIWALVLVGGAVALIVWLANRSRTTERETPPEVAFARYEAAAQTRAAGTAAPGAGAPGAGAPGAGAPVWDASGADASGATAAAATATAATASPTSPIPPSAPSPPTAPANGAASGDYDEWRQRHEAWRVEHDAWKRSQTEANRAARAQLAAQNAARAAEFQAQAEQERQQRRATRPRTSFAFVIAALGAAMLAGAVASLIALSTEAADVAVAIGLAAATVITALSMVVAGALRRRSGFLAFVTIVLFVCTLGAAAIPGTPRFVIGSTFDAVSSSTYVVPAGSVQLVVDDRLDGAAPVETEVLQGAGSVAIDLTDGARADIRVECGSCFIAWDRVDAGGERTTVEGAQLTGGQSEWSWTRAVGAGLTEGETDAVITIRAGASDVRITEYTED
jgi:phage shock protein PspC (stress-responsive transcriptional regulator)